MTRLIGEGGEYETRSLDVATGKRGPAQGPAMPEICCLATRAVFRGSYGFNPLEIMAASQSTALGGRVVHRNGERIYLMSSYYY